MDLPTLSLCAGVGGLDLGLKLAANARTVCYVEWAEFPAAVIAARAQDGLLDDAPIWDDVGTFDGRPWRGKVDCLAAGFPCQPVSLAGKRLGMADERFIWGDVARIISEVRPRYVFLENVAGIVTADGGAFLGRVLGDLVALGFDSEWDVFSASETGAPHRRERWFCLAVVNTPSVDEIRRGDTRGRRDGLADPGVYPPPRNDAQRWSTVLAQDPTLEPAFRGTAHGLASGMDATLSAYWTDRLTAIGNGVVPLTAALAWTELLDRIGR